MDRIVDLREKLDGVNDDIKEFFWVRASIGYVAFGLTMFFHLSGWLDSHHVIGLSQWLYIAPFFVVMGLLGLWLMRESVQLKKILGRSK